MYVVVVQIQNDTMAAQNDSNEKRQEPIVHD